MIFLPTDDFEDFLFDFDDDLKAHHSIQCSPSPGKDLLVSSLPIESLLKEKKKNFCYDVSSSGKLCKEHVHNLHDSSHRLWKWRPQQGKSSCSHCTAAAWDTPMHMELGSKHGERNEHKLPETQEVFIWAESLLPYRLCLLRNKIGLFDDTSDYIWNESLCVCISCLCLGIKRSRLMKNVLQHLSQIHGSTGSGFSIGTFSHPAHMQSSATLRCSVCCRRPHNRMETSQQGLPVFAIRPQLQCKLQTKHSGLCWGKSLPLFSKNNEMVKI